MRTAARWSVILACGLAASPVLAAAAAPEQFGSWVIRCPGNGPCLMHSSQRLLDQAGITGDLEVEAQGSTLVPVITLRGLRPEMLAAASLAGKTSASIQFPGGPRHDLACGASVEGYICAPSESNGSLLAAALPGARSVTVRVAVTVAGSNPLGQEKSLHLTGTKAALDRLRSVGPSPVPSFMTAPSPSGLKAMADKAMNGVAKLQALVAQYMKK